MVNYPTNIQTGYLFDADGKKFDVSVILNFPNEADYANATCPAEWPEVNLIDFYFGEPDDDITNDYVAKFVERQLKLESLRDLLVALKNDLEYDGYDEHIQLVESLLVTLH